MSGGLVARETGGRARWSAVARQELRDLWLGGRGPVLAFAFTALLSVIAYLSATNEALNFLEQRESVNLTLQVAVAVGALLALVVAADAVSGERERGTLETLLLTPVPRAQILLGKLLAVLSFWFVALLLAVPYVWFLGRGVGVVGEAMKAGLLVGTPVAVALAALGVSISTVAATNRLSLSVSVLVLLALYAPTQLPLGASQGWLAELLLRVNPVTAAEHYSSGIVITAQPWSQDTSWLLSPVVAAVVLTAVALVIAPRAMTLDGGVQR
jgi:ABC-2 type transport system permease protein